jgi:hypothetical protein
MLAVAHKKIQAADKIGSKANKTAWPAGRQLTAQFVAKRASETSV